jgi:hypothetical protein
MLVIGSSNGRVTFYDYELKLLYWCQSCNLDSIRWISFSLDPDILIPTSTDTSESKLEKSFGFSVFLSSLSFQGYHLFIIV